MQKIGDNVAAVGSEISPCGTGLRALHTILTDRRNWRHWIVAVCSIFGINQGSGRLYSYTCSLDGLSELAKTTVAVSAF